MEELGEESALGKLIQQELEHPTSTAEAAEASKESPALVAFWKQTSKFLHRSLRDTLQNVEQLIKQKEAETFFAEAWEPEELGTGAAQASASSKASGRLDGSDNSLQAELETCRST